VFESVVAVVFQCVFTRKYIKIIYFFIFKKLFLISAHQNDLKTPKTYKFEAKKKIKNFKFFLKTLLKYQNKPN
jgi:hypothetical protein